MHIERAQELLAPHVDPVFWLNVQLVRLQYFSRTKEYDKSIAFVDEVTPIVLKDYVFIFGTLINYKAITQFDKGDIDAAIETRRYLVRTQDSLNNAFSADQLNQVKEIYHIDELLLEKQKNQEYKLFAGLCHITDSFGFSLFILRLYASSFQKDSIGRMCRRRGSGTFRRG